MGRGDRQFRFGDPAVKEQAGEGRLQALLEPGLLVRGDPFVRELPGERNEACADRRDRGERQATSRDGYVSHVCRSRRHGRRCADASRSRSPARPYS